MDVRERVRQACVWAGVTSAVVVAAASAGPRNAGKETPVLEKHAFTEKLDGWERQGEAEFDLDPTETHEGRPAARVTIAPGTRLSYQQLRRDFTDVRVGDELRASVWVRSRGVDQAPGAYMALEFLGEGGARAGIAHSKTGEANGAGGWERLSAEGTAPKGTVGFRLSLILHGHGTAWFAAPEVVRTGRQEEWPDLGGAERRVQVRTGEVVHPRFGGIGFHAFHHSFDVPEREMDEVIYKRWRETNPSFVRMNHNWGWDRAALDRMAEHLLRMKQTGTEVYVATWNPPDATTPEELAAYARDVVDSLEYLYRQRGATNIRTYCMSNELSLKGWGVLIQDLPKFRAYHQALYDELKRRNLPIQLLATDASPIERWSSIEWAAESMDAITGVYGGHHYINDWPLDDERFYPWFRDKMAWGAGIARRRGKDFILGEFGPKQDGRTINGIRMDACIYWDTPKEPLVPIQVAEAVVAAINGGVYAAAYWTFMDCPDDGFGKGYRNKWGLFKCSGDDRSTRAIHYGYGLLSKFFRGPARVFGIECADPRLRVAAVQHHGAGTWSIAVVNRNERDVPLSLAIDGKPVSAVFRKYVYDPARVPQHPFGDLQGPSGTVAMKAGRLADTVGAGQLVVYTTAYDTQPPAPVRGVKAAPVEGGKTRVTWEASREADLCYYRVYRGKAAGFTPDESTRIGSTVATEFVDDRAAEGGPWHYGVFAVDQSGNASAR